MIYGVSDHYSVLTVCTFGVMLRFSINFNMNSSDTPSCSRHGLHSITLLMGKQGEGNKIYTEKRGVGAVRFTHKRGKERTQTKQRLKQHDHKLTEHRHST